VAEESTRDFQDPKDTKKYLAARRGGTMHQISEGAQGLLTTIPGGIVPDTRNTLRSGEQGLHVARATIGQATYRGGKAAALVGGEGRVSEGAV
jgi:hypothetical protein